MGKKRGPVTTSLEVSVCIYVGDAEMVGEWSK